MLQGTEKNHRRTSMSQCCVFQNVPLGPPDVSVQRAVLAMNSPTRPLVSLAASRTDPLLSRAVPLCSCFPSEDAAAVCSVCLLPVTLADDCYSLRTFPLSLLFILSRI